MNQGRIWCVVHPTVGLPLLLGSVALTSLAVHTAIMTHTTWMGGYWMGAKARVSEAAPSGRAVAGSAGGNAFSMTVTPVPASDPAAATSFVITVGPAATVTQTDAQAGAQPPDRQTRTASSVPGPH